MQIGTRFAVGGDVPQRLPAPMVEALRAHEATLTGVDTARWRWTMTWLENRPVLDLDDGTVIRLAPDGSVSTRNADTDLDEED